MQFERRILKNGIKVLFEKRDSPVVSLAVANPFGGAFEKVKEKGVAHFIEHLLFTGTKTRSHEDISKEIEKRGGVINAFTAQDVTAYWFKVPAEHVFIGLEVISDILNNAIFDVVKFEKEKKVILEEIKMYHDNPQRYVFEMIEENLFEYPFGMGIAGKKETVSALERDAVFSLFKKMYNPKNYVVVIVGNVNIDAVCSLLETLFKPNKDPIPFAQRIVLKNSHTTQKREGIDQAHVVFASHAPMASDQKKYVLEVLDAYLANGMSSRLFLTIREDRGLAYAVKSTINTEKSYSYYSIYVGTMKDAVQEVNKLILDGFVNIKEMTSQNLNEAKERLVGLRKVSAEESVNVLQELLFHEISTGKAEDYYDHEKNIRKVSLQDVKSLAKDLIKSYSSAVIIPA